MSKTIKWLVAVAVIGGILWFLQSLSTERPLVRMEKPVTLDELK